MYLKGYAAMGELMVGLAEYFAFYNGERPHQSLGQKTPDVVYRTAIGGGVMIVDKFGGAVEEPPVPLRSTGASSTAEARAEATAKTKQRQHRGSAVQLRVKSNMQLIAQRISVLTQGPTLEVVLRLLRAASRLIASRGRCWCRYKLELWRDRALAGIDAGLQERENEQLRAAVTEFADRYNRHWRFEELGSMSPIEARQAYAIRKAA